MKKISMLICLIITSAIGAGIFSGKEILTFFGRPSLWGIVCAIFSAFAFFIIILLSLNAKNKYNNIISSKAFKFFSVICCVCVLAGMLAGINVIQNEIFTFNFPIFAVIICSLSIYLCTKKYQFFKKFNLVLCVLMVATILYICTKSLDKYNEISIMSQVKFPIFKSLIFASFNLFFIFPILTKEGETLSKKQKYTTSIFSTLIILFTILICMFSLTNSGETPFISVAKNVSNVFYYVYLSMFLISILTTLFSVLYSLKAYSGPKSFYFLVATGFFISLIGFSNVVSIFYLIAGLFSCAFFLFCYCKAN